MEPDQDNMTQQQQPPHIDCEEKKNLDQTIISNEGSVKSEQIKNAELKTQSSRKTYDSGSKKSSSSAVARKKKLELEAAEAKARIEMDLIEKRLQLDLSKIDEEYSSHAESDRASTRSEVERWMERSQPELELPHAHDHGTTRGTRCPSVAAAAGTDGPVQQLVAALKELVSTSSTENQQTKLLSRISTPKELPVFTGDPMEWLQFKQAFEESTRVCSFSEIENMWRLRKSVRGPAKDCVAALLMSGTSPEIIMSTLELQYGNPDVILRKIEIEIKKLHPLPQEYHKEIVMFAIRIKNYVAAIRALNRTEYLHGINVVSTILSKLPTVLLPKWTDYSYPLIIQGTKSKLDILAEFLSEEAVKVSTCSATLIQPRSDFKRRNYDSGAYQSQTVLVQSGQNFDKCRYCRLTKHKLTECKKFKKSLRKDRWQHVKRFSLCYKCLVSQHDRQTCTAAACDAEGCGQPHHRLLHYVPSRNSHRDDNFTEQVLEQDNQTETVTHINIDKCQALLKVVPINIHGPNGIIRTTALLDDGSSVSLISATLAAQAGLRGRRECLRVRGAWDNNELVCDTQLIDLSISNNVGTMFTVGVRSVNNLNLPKQNLSIVNCDVYPHLEKIKSDLNNRLLKPEILIGQDHYHLIVPLEVIMGRPCEPCATRTPLGWCVHGMVSTLASSSRAAPHSTMFITNTTEDDLNSQNNRILQEIHDDLRRFFSIDSMGVAAKIRQNSEDVRAQEHLERTSELIDGQWYVGLPWKDERCVTVDSYPTALTRLQGVEQKMKKDEKYAQRYKERIQHLFDNDYAKLLEDISITPKTWYLPHFGVDNPNKKKLRLVYDAAAKTKGSSLNDYLLVGPDLLMSLMGIMLRFRENKIAITGDIRDMYLRVKIKSDDQHAFRFLYRTGPNEPVRTYIMTSLIFGANCSPFIAQFIKNKNAKRFESSMPAATNAIYIQHYMDDYIDSLPSEQEAEQLIRDVTYIHKQGNFEICNWNCNREKLINDKPKGTLCTNEVRFKVDQQYKGERTLGLLWKPAEDTLGFDVSLKKIPENISNGKQRPTKRDILRVVMSIFDVYGFLSPFTINGKIILQESWQLKIDWDEPVPEIIYKKWIKWISQLKSMNEVRLPRYYQAAASASETTSESISNEPCGGAPAPAPSKPVIDCYTNLQLHIFCDASLKAICSVAYWRWINNNNSVCLAFIASKCRVATVKPTSVPRMELQAAVLAARLSETIIKEHRIKPNSRIFWSDSTTVLHWIKNDSRNYKTYVANRLGEIDELTQITDWRYIPTHLNVADIATREAYTLTLPNEWIYGPSFLRNDEKEWPQDQINAEINKEQLECVSVIHQKMEDLPIPDPTRFSSWMRLLRAAYVVLKFINKCKRLTDEDDASIMEKAENLLLKNSQTQTFHDEISLLKNGKNVPRNSKILTLSPYLDEHDVLRAGGRIDVAADVTPETKRPIILDGRDYTARLLVKHYHVLAAHGNQESIVNNLRQKYWITRIRPTVKNVASKCMFCRIRKCSQEIPRMGDLPQARVAHHQRPYTFCGVDLFGPMEVTIKKRREKRYGVLFTCMTVRAIHIEIVSTLTSDSFIMALRRMAARRGWPQNLFSDNGTNLRGADTELKKSIQELDEAHLKNEALKYGTKWTFIPAATPHWGGAWERLIRHVKTCLRIVLKERAPREETLTTLLTEVENIVNSRPLTHVSVEPGSVETLTPNHFLIGSSSNLPHMGVFNDSEFYLRKQWRIAQRLADMYWKRWTKEVLPDLIPRRKWNQEVRPLQVGDLVLVVDPNGPRSSWPRGLIKEVLPGRDGRVRAVKIKTKNGELLRSAARVARLPIAEECC